MHKNLNLVSGRELTLEAGKPNLLHCARLVGDYGELAGLRDIKPVVFFYGFEFGAVQYVTVRCDRQRAKERAILGSPSVSSSLRSQQNCGNDRREGSLFHFLSCRGP